LQIRRKDGVSIGSLGVAAFGRKNLAKPSAVVMACTGHSDYSANKPPTFVVVGDRDGIAPPSLMERRPWFWHWHVDKRQRMDQRRYPLLGALHGDGTRHSFTQEVILALHGRFATRTELDNNRLLTRLGAT